MRVVNPRTVKPDEFEVGDVMCAIVKAMVVRVDSDGTVHYRLYRCEWPATPGQIPQGQRTLDEGIICQQVFPTLAHTGVIDDL